MNVSSLSHRSTRHAAAEQIVGPKRGAARSFNLLPGCYPRLVLTYCNLPRPVNSDVCRYSDG